MAVTEEAAAGQDRSLLDKVWGAVRGVGEDFAEVGGRIADRVANATGQGVARERVRERGIPEAGSWTVAGGVDVRPVAGNAVVAGLEAAADAGTFGHADEIMALATPREGREERLRQYRSERAERRAQSPIAATVGTAAGAATTLPLAFAGTAARAANLSQAAQTAASFERMRRGLAAAGLMGAAAGAGASEAEDPGGVVQDAGEGAAMGLGFEMALPAAGAALRAGPRGLASQVADAAQGVADQRRVRAAGIRMKRDATAVERAGGPAPIARVLREEGMTGLAPEDVVERARELRRRSGDEIGRLLEEASAARAQGPRPESPRLIAGPGRIPTLDDLERAASELQGGPRPSRRLIEGPGPQLTPEQREAFFGEAVRPPVAREAVETGLSPDAELFLQWLDTQGLANNAQTIRRNIARLPSGARIQPRRMPVILDELRARGFIEDLPVGGASGTDDFIGEGAIQIRPEGQQAVTNAGIRWGDAEIPEGGVRGVDEEFGIRFGDDLAEPRAQTRAALEANAPDEVVLYKGAMHPDEVQGVGSRFNAVTPWSAAGTPPISAGYGDVVGVRVPRDRIALVGDVGVPGMARDEFVVEPGNYPVVTPRVAGQDQDGLEAAAARVRQELGRGRERTLIDQVLARVGEPGYRGVPFSRTPDEIVTRLGAGHPGLPPTPERLVRGALGRLQRRGLVANDAEQLSLTPEGREALLRRSLGRLEQPVTIEAAEPLMPPERPMLEAAPDIGGYREPPGRAPRVDVEGLLEQIRAQRADAVDRAAPTAPALRRVERMLESLARRGATPAQAHRTRRDLDQMASWGRQLPPPEALQTIRGARGQLDDALKGAIAEQADPSLRSALEVAEERFRAARILEDGADNFVRGERAGVTPLRLTDTIAGTGAAAAAVGTGNPVALLGMAAGPLARRYGDRALARTAEGVADAARAVARPPVSGAAASSGAARIAATNPPRRAELPQEAPVEEPSFDDSAYFDDATYDDDGGGGGFGDYFDDPTYDEAPPLAPAPQAAPAREVAPADAPILDALRGGEGEADPSVLERLPPAQLELLRAAAARGAPALNAQLYVLRRDPDFRRLVAGGEVTR